MSPNGHVVTAVESTKSVELVYLQPESGQELLRLVLDAEEVTSLDFSPNGQLYVACTKADRRGVYRLEAFFKQAKQSVRCIEVANADGLEKMSCGEGGVCVGLVRDDEGGRLVRLEGTK